jgi:hypothetical protein
MVCRNVSKLWRAEAESEFARNRLPQLYFNWRFNIYKVEYQNESYRYSGSCKTIQMAHVPINSEIVFFDVRFTYLLHGRGDQPLKQDIPMKPWKPELIAQIRKLFTYSDTELENRHRLFIFIGSNANEIEILGFEIDFDKHQVSFLWKSFLTRYFHDEAYVRSRRKSMGLCHQDHPMVAHVRDVQALADPAVTLDFVCGRDLPIGQLDTEVYTQALAARLPEVYKQVMNSTWSALRWKWRVHRLHVFRQRQLLISLLEKQGNWSQGRKEYMDLCYHHDGDGNLTMRLWQKKLGHVFNSQLE